MARTRKGVKVEIETQGAIEARVTCAVVNCRLNGWMKFVHCVALSLQGVMLVLIVHFSACAY